MLREDVGVPTRSFRLSATVDATPQQVIDFLMQLDGHRGLHPYLQSAEVVDEGAGDDGPWQDWRVVERPAFWGIRYTLAFPARMTRSSPTSMIGDVRAAPGCRLRTVTTAVPVTAGSVVEETTTVTTPWPVTAYMTKHAELAHARTFTLLPAQFTP